MNRRFASFDQAAPLLLRVGVGLLYTMSGSQKIMGGVAGTTAFFTKLGIPMPGVMGPFISYLELLGGLALLLGLLTRVFSLLLVCDMTVAMLTSLLPRAWQAANLPAGYATFRLEFLAITALLTLALVGAGAYSLDALMFKRRTGVQPATETARAY